MEQRIGCLVIHGFGGSIREVKPLVEALEVAGYLTKCPELKGHTGVKGDLRSVTYNDWISSAEEELTCLEKECKDVFIVGFSMGGLIGVNLCLKHKVKALITINTPIYYFDLKKIVGNVLHDLRTRDFSNIRRYLKPQNRLPPKALWNFRVLLYKTKQLLSLLNTRLLVMQATDDDVVQSRSANYIYIHAGSKEKRLATYPAGGHVILLSSASPGVISDTLNYIAEGISA
jgi:carboxylesterase